MNHGFDSTSAGISKPKAGSPEGLSHPSSQKHDSPQPKGGNTQDPLAGYLGRLGRRGTRARKVFCLESLLVL